MNPHGNTREINLLLDCARARADHAAIQTRIRSGVDWRSFLALAETHRLSALAGRRLEDAAAAEVPPAVRDQLQGHLRRNTQRNLFLTGELCRVLARLEEGGVRALAFKGAVLAWWLYEHPGLRQFQDLDLLVDERDLAKARALLADAGYRPETEGGVVKMIPSGGQMTLLRDVPPAAIDLHWELAPHAMDLGLNARWALPRAMAVSVAGRRVLTFGTEDQVLLCAFHGGKHAWSNLGWLADLAALIEKCPLDWTRLLAEARRKALTRALLTGLLLVDQLWQIPMPAEIRGPMERDPAASFLAADARAHLFNGSARRRLFPRELNYEFRLTEGCRRKGLFLWRKMTQPSEQDWRAQAAARPFRLMGKYALRLAGHRSAA